MAVSAWELEKALNRLLQIDAIRGHVVQTLGNEPSSIQVDLVPSWEKEFSEHFLTP